MTFRLGGGHLAKHVIMVDATTALKVSTLIGTVYAGDCILGTKAYLADQGVSHNSGGTAYLTRGIAGGVIGITTMNDGPGGMLRDGESCELMPTIHSLVPHHHCRALTG